MPTITITPTVLPSLERSARHAISSAGHRLESDALFAPTLSALRAQCELAWADHDAIAAARASLEVDPDVLRRHVGPAIEDIDADLQDLGVDLGEPNSAAGLERLGLSGAQLGELMGLLRALQDLDALRTILGGRAQATGVARV